MTEEEARDEIRRLMGAFPSLAAWFGKQPDQDTLRVAWCRQLGRSHAEDVAAVVTSIIDGDLELPPNYEYDRTALMIRHHANERRTKIVDQQRVSDMRKPRATLNPQVEAALARFRASTETPKPIHNRPR